MVFCSFSLDAEAACDLVEGFAVHDILLDDFTLFGAEGAEEFTYFYFFESIFIILHKFELIFRIVGLGQLFCFSDFRFFEIPIIGRYHSVCVADESIVAACMVERSDQLDQSDVAELEHILVAYTEVVAAAVFD